jgi:hypothetical protein
VLTGRSGPIQVCGHSPAKPRSKNGHETYPGSRWQPCAVHRYPRRREGPGNRHAIITAALVLIRSLSDRTS